jgi:hypothetical protein
LGYGMFHGTEASFLMRAVHELLSVAFEASWKNLGVCNIM